MTQETLLFTLPGTRDLLPDELARWQFVEQSARDVFGRYGFREIRTPLIEATELFARSIGQDTDIVGKEMYTFRDQSGKSITLRPEATASVVRAYVQHAMYRGSGTTKLYYLGPMFRHEKKQKGRWRQFYQIGAEVLGCDHPAVEVETIEMVMALLNRVEVKAGLLVNSVGDSRCRPQYVELLREELRRVSAHLCEDCRRRTESNPLRVLDCKVESCQPYIERLPRITEHLCEDCRLHFERFRGYLTLAGIPFEIAPRLVRGLDYYVRTAFEIVSVDLGAQNALVGGGRYDGLSEVLGGPPVSGFGFAMGLDRLVMLLPERISERWSAVTDLFLAHMGEPALGRALELARTLRSEGFRCNLDFDGGSLKSQLRLANRLNARHVLIIGEDELAGGRYLLKDLSDSSQRKLEAAEIVRHLRSLQPDPRPGQSDKGA
jgi:histidyl-tRNA synthetase